MADKSNMQLFQLLNCSSSSKPLDHNAIIKEVQENPYSAQLLYSFSYGTTTNSTCHCFPLHKAIMLSAPLNVINDLYDSHPIAIKEEINRTTALHLAIRCNATSDVLAYIFSKWPEATRKKDSKGNTPLHLACHFHKDLDVLSMLYDGWPDASREEDKSGMTPLHYVCFQRNAPLENVSLLLRGWPRNRCPPFSPLHFACLNNSRAEVVSLLVNHFPSVLFRNDRLGLTPLHYACKGNAPLEVIMLLLEKWPEGSRKEDYNGATPLDCCRKANISAENRKVVSYVSQLFGKGINNDADFYVFGRFFAEINWWTGISWVIKRRPLIAQSLGIDTKVMPHFLALTGKSCKLDTVWQIITNKQELMPKS